MPWFKVDDALYSHPKWVATTPAARGVWVTAGSWCAAHLTDGRIPRHVLPFLGGRTKDAAELVRNGLWVNTDDGWAFHDWLSMQPSAEQVETERASARERQRRARDKARESRRDIDRESHRTDAGSHSPPDPTRPTTPPTPAERGTEHRGQHANCRACGTNPRGPKPVPLNPSSHLQPVDQVLAELPDADVELNVTGIAEARSRLRTRSSELA